VIRRSTSIPSVGKLGHGLTAVTVASPLAADTPREPEIVTSRGPVGLTYVPEKIATRPKRIAPVVRYHRPRRKRRPGVVRRVRRIVRVVAAAMAWWPWK
jgi:hypothetical protein